MKFLCLQSTSVIERYGGVEYYLNDLLHEFARLFGNTNVSTIVPIHGKHGEKKSVSTAHYQVNKVVVSSKGIWRKLEHRFPVRMFLKALLLSLRSRPDLIICGHVSLGPLAYLLSKILGKPFVTIAYGIDVWGRLFPQDEWCLKKANSIISISHCTKNILINRGYPAKKIHVIHPTIFKELLGSTLPNIETKKGVFTLLTVSRLDSSERYKGHDDVLDALSNIKKTDSTLAIQYLIQGGGTDKERLIQKVKELDLERWVSFIEPAHTREELIQIYRKANVFIMPSKFGYWGGRWRGEGFGIVYAEAGALGIPSIAYRCGGATDIIEHMQTGVLVTPNNVAELSHSILYCLNNPGVVREMGERARTRVGQLFTAQSMSHSIHAFVNSFTLSS